MAHVELGIEERRRIERLRRAGVPVASIAARLRRHRSTVCRELARNRFGDEENPYLGGCHGMVAQSMAAARRHRRRKLVRMPSLPVSIVDRLRAGWSPARIAGRLRRGGSGAYVCHETIYAWVCPEEGRERRLARFLPSRLRRRRRRHGRTPREAKFPDVRSIHRRPEAVADRREFGHREADLMIFRRGHGSANVATVVERKTRYVAPYRNEDRRSRRVPGRPAGLLGPLPAAARRSVTFDRGLEFAAWRGLTNATGIDVRLGRSSGPAPERRRGERRRTHPPLAAAGYAGRRPAPRLDGSPLPTPRHDTAQVPRLRHARRSVHRGNGRDHVMDRRRVATKIEFSPQS
jgi:IS30 family transposase